jgi:hypothetical protein
MTINLEFRDESFIVGLAFAALLITIVVMLTTSLFAYNCYVKYLEHQPKPTPVVNVVEKPVEVPK